MINVPNIWMPWSLILPRAGKYLMDHKSKGRDDQADDTKAS